jgi:hypothetical protein
MACPMYAFLTTMLFRVPTDPGPLAIYYPPPIKMLDINGNPVLDAAGQPTYVVPTPIGCTKQAKINARFNRAKNYWLSYINI